MDSLLDIVITNNDSISVMKNLVNDLQINGAVKIYLNLYSINMVEAAVIKGILKSMEFQQTLNLIEYV